MAAEAADTFSGTMRVPSGAEGVAKTGQGTWTLPLGSVWSRDANLPVSVHEGALALTSGGTIPAASDTPPAAMAKAALWIEASTNTVEWTQDASRIVKWYDVRETKGAGGTWSAEWPRLESRVSYATSGGAPITNYPSLASIETASGTRSMMYFNGVKTGGWMRFRTKSNTDSNITRIYHAFAAINIVQSHGFIFGNVGAGVFLHPSSVFGSIATGLGYYSSPRSGDASAVSGRFFLDGVQCESSSTMVKTGVQVLEVESGDCLGVVGTIFNDRGIANRYGGDYVGEMVFFTNKLSDVERLDVSEYLLRKWVGEPPRNVPTVALSESAVLRNPSKATFSGTGTAWLEEGTTVARKPGDPFYGLMYKPADDAATTLEIGEVPLNLVPGDRLSANKSTYDDIQLTRTEDATDAANGVVTHSGTASLRIQSLSGVKVFSTGSDELILTGRQRPRTAISTNLYAVIADGNGDFEAYTRANTNPNGTVSGTSERGWTLVSETIQPPDNSAIAIGSVCVLSYNRLLPGGNANWWINATSADYAVERFLPPDGGAIVGIKRAGHVLADVVVPESGDWEFAYYGTGRLSYDFGEVTLALIDGSVSPAVTNTFAKYLQPAGRGWRHYRYLLRNLKAGTYRLKVAMRGVRPNADCHAMFDCFQMKLVSASNGTVQAVEPPNGSFDIVDCPYDDRTTYSYHVTAPGWTLVQGTQGKNTIATNGPARSCEVGIAVLPQIDASGNRMWYNPRARYGHAQLRLHATGGYAKSDAFTLPAGTWRLRARASNWAFTDSANFKYDTMNPTVQGPRLGASVFVNGNETALGTSADYDTVNIAPVDQALPNTFTVSESDSVEIKLWQAKAGTETTVAELAVDGVYFERADYNSSELIVNGSFEPSGSLQGWTVNSNRGSQTNSTDDLFYCNAFAKKAPDVNYGNTQCDGPWALGIVDIGQVSQNIDFPEAGIYTLRFWARSRYYMKNDAVNLYYAGNQVRAWLVPNGSTVTQEIYRTASVYSTNFLEHAVLFRIGTPGRYTFGLQGCNRYPDNRTSRDGSGRDANVLVDAISIKKGFVDGTPNLDKDLRLMLDSTSKLRLDYEGTNTIKRLRLGGRSESGFFDASHPSGLVSGIGCLYVPPYGTMLMFR